MQSVPNPCVWDYVNRSKYLPKSQWSLKTKPADPPAIQKLKYSDIQPAAKHLYFLPHHGLTATRPGNFGLTRLAFPCP